MRSGPEVTRRLLLAACAGLGAGVAVPPPTLARGEGQVSRRSAIAFGTTVSLTLVARPGQDIGPAFAAGFAAIRAVERAANLFDPNSEISRLNRIGRIDAPSPLFRDLVRFALRLADESGGAFDPTVQPVWEVWSAAARQGRLAAASDLRRAVERVGHADLRLEADAVRFTRPGMGLTLNALAQGHATDLVLAAVSAAGVRDAFLDTGELGAAGVAPGARGWRVSLADPRRSEAAIGALDLASRRFMATSGDWQCSWTPDFSEHHIVEPWSGHSPREFAEIAVVAASGLVADGLSTALMVAPQHRHAALLRLDPGAGAVRVDKAGQVSFAGGGLDLQTA